MTDSSTVVRDSLPMTRRVMVPLQDAGGSPLSAAEWPLLARLLSDGMGMLAVDLDIADGPADAIPHAVGSAVDRGLEVSLVVPPERLTDEFRRIAEPAALRRIVLCPRPGGSPPAADAFRAPDVEVRLRVDLALPPPQIDDWLIAAEDGAKHVDLQLAKCLPSVEPAALEWLVGCASRLHRAQIPWAVRGVPHCALENRARIFGPRQESCDLFWYDPEAQAVVTELTALESGVRWIRLTQRLRRAERYFETGVSSELERLVLELSSRPALRKPVAALRAVFDASGLRRLLRRSRASGPEPRIMAPSATYRAACVGCALRPVCAGPTDGFLARFGERAVRPVPPPVIEDPLAFLRLEPPFVPSLDVPRVSPPLPEHVAEAWERSQDLGSAVEISSGTYRPEHGAFDKMNGSVQWKGLRDRLARSTVLFSAAPPFTVDASFFGDADHVGFTLGGGQQIMCSMSADHNRVVLYVDASGRYVLLRDGEPVDPVHIPGRIFRAGLLSREVDVRLAVSGMRRAVITQQVRRWASDTADDEHLPAGSVDLSVVVVCVGFSRRLSLLLRSIAQQRDFDPRRAEVLVAHVPEADATADVLDSASQVWPNLRVVPVRFHERQRKWKGHLVNQCVGKASGRRVILTDADIVFPPDLLARLETDYRDDHFVAVAGRKMLDKATTAELLLGVRDPVRDFDWLANEAPGELRLQEAKGVPIGCFQCVLRSHFLKVQYEELPHFEGADWRFALSIREAFGMERRIPDRIVLHLDHGGSRWYGTDRQM